MNPFSIRLNLPEAAVRLRRSDRGVEIFDPLRRRWLVIRPEEWVRQQFTSFLTSSLSVPAGLMANEVSIDLNGTSKRCDTVIYDRLLRPVCIVEYKAPSVTLTMAAVEQIARYNLVLDVPWLIISNGLRHLSFVREGEVMRPCDHLPAYDEMTASR